MIDPAEVVSDLGFRVLDVMKFCEELLTGVNAHTAAHIIRALQLGDYKAACRLVEIEQVMEIGPLFGLEVEKISDERDAIFEKLSGEV